MTVTRAGMTEQLGSAAPVSGSGRPRVLVVCPLMPFPADEGRKRRQSAIIHSLAKRFDVTLIAFGDPRTHSSEQLLHEGVAEALVFDRDEAYGRQRSAQRWLRHLTYWCSLDPWLVRERRSERLRAFLQETSGVAWQAVVVLNLPISGSVRPWLSSWRARGIRVVLDGDDHECVKQLRIVRALPASLERIKQWVEWRRIRRYERRWLPEFAQVWMCHEADAAALTRCGGRTAVVVPNTVGLPPKYEAGGGTGTWDLVFVGMMGYIANVDAVLWFTRSVWPKIRAARPQARFAVVGKRPAPEVMALNGRDGIVVTGEVPDTDAYLRSAKVVIIPMRLGGGTRIKALDAFAAGAAVVSTPIGVEGLSLTDSREALVAQTPAAFASSCLRLLDDAEQRRRLGESARRFVEARYTHAALDTRLEALLPIQGAVS